MENSGDLGFSTGRRGREHLGRESDESGEKLLDDAGKNIRLLTESVNPAVSKLAVTRRER